MLNKEEAYHLKDKLNNSLKCLLSASYILYV